MTTVEQLETLENTGMIDLMHHQYVRAQTTIYHINVLAFWQRWIRN